MNTLIDLLLGLRRPRVPVLCILFTTPNDRFGHQGWIFLDDKANIMITDAMAHRRKIISRHGLLIEYKDVLALVERVNCYQQKQWVWYHTEVQVSEIALTLWLYIGCNGFRFLLFPVSLVAICLPCTSLADVMFLLAPQFSKAMFYSNG